MCWAFDNAEKQEYGQVRILTISAWALSKKGFDFWSCFLIFGRMRLVQKGNDTMAETRCCLELSGKEWRKSLGRVEQSMALMVLSQLEYRIRV